jgi:hypothetical protein
MYSLCGEVKADIKVIFMYFEVTSTHHRKIMIMTRSILLASMLTIGIAAQAQDTRIEPIRRYEGTVEYQKTQQPCTILEFNYPSRDMDKAMEEYARKAGGRMGSSKGWNIAKGVKLDNRGGDFYDVYYKVEGKGKNEKATCTVYMIFAEPGENIVARPTNSSGVAITSVAASAAFLGGLGSHVGDFDMTKKLSEQEDLIKKAERKYNGLVDDGKNLEGKRTKLEKDIQDNANAQAEAQQELEKLKGLLEQLKGKKKGGS